MFFFLLGGGGKTPTETIDFTNPGRGLYPNGPSPCVRLWSCEIIILKNKMSSSTKMLRHFFLTNVPNIILSNLIWATPGT